MIQATFFYTIQVSIFPIVGTRYLPTMKLSFQPSQITCGAPYATPSDKTTFLRSKYHLIYPSVISIKDPTYYISDQPNNIPKISLRRDYSMLPTVQLNLALSHITS